MREVPRPGRPACPTRGCLEKQRLRHPRPHRRCPRANPTSETRMLHAVVDRYLWEMGVLSSSILYLGFLEHEQ